jgi:hypothetical protein
MRFLIFVICLKRKTNKSTLNKNELETIKSTMGIIVGYKGFFDVVDQIEELGFNNQFHTG